MRAGYYQTQMVTVTEPQYLRQRHLNSASTSTRCKDIRAYVGLIEVCGLQQRGLERWHRAKPHMTGEKKLDVSSRDQFNPDNSG